MQPHPLSADPQVAAAVAAEEARQRSRAQMIASENLVSPAVMAASGSVLTNKYAEGYPGKRYYGGCEEIDAVESLAIQRAKELFGAQFANVQPHSGSSANLAVFMALLAPGDTVCGLALSSGGHLTHGHHVSASGIFFKSAPYAAGPDGRIDYAALRAHLAEHRPKLVVAGFTAYPRDVDWAAFRAACDELGAYLMADIAHTAGLVAGGVLANPVGIADVVTTTTHKTLRGPRGGMVLTNRQDVFDKVQKAVFPGLQGGPLGHQMAARAVAFGEALKPSFRDYARQVAANAKALEGVFSQAGLTMVTGGTDTHLLVLDVRPLGLDGAAAEKVLAACHIVCNKNTVPGETGSAFKPSGIRLGTPALTTRGLKEADVAEIGSVIVQALRSPQDAALHERLARQVSDKLDTFPLFAW